MKTASLTFVFILKYKNKGDRYKIQKNFLRMFKNFGNPIPEDLSHHIKCQTCAILILKPLHPALPDPESSPDASLQLLPSESRTVHLPVRLQTRAKPEWKHRLSGKSRDRLPRRYHISINSAVEIIKQSIFL